MAFLEWCIHEMALHSLFSTGTRDTYLILASRFLRMVAYGATALVLVVYLWTEGLQWKEIGPFLSMALLGDAALSYLLTLKADKIGRRRVLMIGSAMMVFSGTTFAWTKNYYLLLFAAIVGVITPGAHEVGPFRAVQESMLAHLTPFSARTDVYAWFAVTSTMGMSVGLLVAGWITYVCKEWIGRDWKEAYPPVFGFYAIIGLIKFGLTFLLTERCEVASKAPREMDQNERQSRAPLLDATQRTVSYTKGPDVTAKIRRIGSTVTAKLSPESRRILIRLCFLFAINSLASGMLPVTIMAWYVNWRYRRFVISRVGYAMSVIWLCASVGNLFSASVARRLGLVKTMVLMHLPHAIFLAFIPLAPNWILLAFMLLVSSALGSIDQAPRMAFVAAVFAPEERTAVMGIINLVRTVSAAGGPLISAYLWEKESWSSTFVVAAALKVMYDIGLLTMFLRTKLPEQDGIPRETVIADVDVGILLREDLTPPEEFGILGDEDEFGGGDIASAPYHDHGKARYEHIEEV